MEGKKTSFARDTRKQESPVNTAQKIASKSSTQQDGKATTEEVPGRLSHYTEEEINTFKDDMASENTKKSMLHAIVVLRKVKNRAELEQHLFLKHCKPGGGQDRSHLGD